MACKILFSLSIIQAIEGAVKALKLGSVSQSDVDRAKAQLKVSVLEELGSSSGRFDDLVAQALRGEIQGKSELVAAIDGISVADVNAVSSNIITHSLDSYKINCAILNFAGGEESCIWKMVNWRCR